MKEFETILAERRAAREKQDGFRILDSIRWRAESADVHSKRIIAGTILAALWIIVGAVLVNGGVTAELRQTQAEAASLAEENGALRLELSRLDELREQEEAAEYGAAEDVRGLYVEESAAAEYNAPAWMQAGEFRIYHYCACDKCTGKRPGDKDYGITATGTKATVGRTISVDPSVIPLGSEVLIGDQTYIAEDTGVSGRCIDIYVGDHAEALRLGTYTAAVSWR